MFLWKGRLKMKQTDFHVVVVDDKENACRRIAERLSGLRVPTKTDEAIIVSVSKVHVSVERRNLHERPEQDQWNFTTKTLKQLVAAAERKADLLIVDYIYIDNEVAKYLKERAKAQEVFEEEIEHRALNPKLLHDWFVQTDQVSEDDERRVLAHLFQSGAPVYIHTYTPEGLSVATGSMEQRNRLTSLAFPNSPIHIIDTRAELFNNDEFDWPGPSKYDSNYYPYQLGVLFGQIVEKEITKSLLERQPEPRRVFVVHGRSEKEKESVARLVERLGIGTIILSEQTNRGRNILKKFQDYSDVGFAVVLLTGDDRGGLATDEPSAYMLRARQNVIFELGYFLSKLGDERVCCLYTSDVEIPSDYSGVLYIPLDDAGAWKQRLARELRDAGFNVDLNKLL